jgi:4-amino-4-deoxy-L-arabinose transferase-like glycosyltransferase
MMAVATAARYPATLARLHASSTTSVGFCAGAVATLAALLRLVGLGSSQDIYVDEPIYVALGQSVHSGGFPMVDGGRFFLHPPAFFYLEAAWQHLFGYRPDVVAAVYEMRALNAVLAAATAAALVLLVARVSSLWPAIATGALFALEPFCIRQNGRVLLETALMFWVVAGLAILLPLAKPRGPSGPRVRAFRQGQLTRFITLPPLTDAGAPSRPRVRAVCAGLLFGLAILTKEEAILVTVLPLLVGAALGWGAERRLMVLAAGVAVLPYLAYVGAILAAGYWGQYWPAKSSALLRFIGVLQQTGFNASGAPSLVGRLIAESTFFGTTYALLALTPLACLLLLRRGNPAQRLLALFYASTAVVLAYVVLNGTLEEQELYLLIVPGLATLGVAAALWDGSRTRTKAFRRIIVSLFALVLAVNVITYLRWRLQPDNGYVRLRQYMAAHIPEGTTVIAVDGTRQVLGTTFRMLHGWYRVVPWVSPREQVSDNARYLVVSWLEVLQGYSYLSTGQVVRLAYHGVPLYSFSGRTYGKLVLYRIPVPDGAGLVARSGATRGL